MFIQCVSNNHARRNRFKQTTKISTSGNFRCTLACFSFPSDFSELELLVLVERCELIA
jgi:hypothetical protein